MKRHSSASLVVCLVLASLDVSSTIAADSPVRHKRSSEQRARDTHSTRIADKNCGQVIYEYRSKPNYSDIKTVCSGPWTPPIIDEY